MNGPLLAIRADASHSGGTGHIMRTLAIAQEWIYRGGRCIYLCATLPDKMQHRLKAEGCCIHLLKSEAASNEEAQETSEALFQLNPHWLLFDSYPLNSTYQAKIQLPSRTRVSAISDFGDNDFHQPDVVIHPNLTATATYRKISDSVKVLSGASYILLRKEIRNSIPLTTSDKAKNLLITMGGSDPKEASAALCESLIENLSVTHLSIIVILGPAYAADGKMHQIKHPNIEIVQSPSSMSDLYHWADTAICSPSTTSFELAHFGLPIGLIITADNQELVLQAMEQMRSAIYLGDAREKLVISNIEPLLGGGKREQVAKNASAAVDGKGASRICDALDLPILNFRSASMNDAKDLWKWTNDPATRAASFNSDPIPWENHITWLEQQLNSEQVLFWIVESEKIKYGVVRYNLNVEAENEAVISIGLAPESRGLGLAPLIITKSSLHFFEKHPEYDIIAWIKPENKASHISFIRANFENYPSPEYPDRLRMRLTQKNYE